MASVGIRARARPRVLARLEQVVLIPLSRDVFDDAGIVDPPELRALDALHLAIALGGRSELAGIATYDRRMITAAAAQGIPTVSPGA